MRTQKEFADVLLAKPDFILFSPSDTTVHKGMKYINGDFSDDGHKH
jgi:hypothetical protein